MRFSGMSLRKAYIRSPHETIRVRLLETHGRMEGYREYRKRFSYD